MEARMTHRELISKQKATIERLTIEEQGQQAGSAGRERKATV